MKQSVRDRSNKFKSSNRSNNNISRGLKFNPSRINYSDDEILKSKIKSKFYYKNKYKDNPDTNTSGVNTSNSNLLALTKEILNRSTCNDNLIYNHKSNDYIGNNKKDPTSNTRHLTNLTNYSTPRGNSNTSNYSIRGKLDYKDKYIKMRQKCDDLKSTLIKERQKVIDLTKKNKKIKRKEEVFDELNNNHKDLIKKHHNLILKLEESELIRKEQAKLIRSMQREIDLLRGSYENNCDTNNERLIEGYKNNLDYEKELFNRRSIPIVNKKKNKSRSKTKGKDLKSSIGINKKFKY